MRRTLLCIMLFALAVSPLAALTSCSPIGPAALALLMLGSKKSDKPSAPPQQPHPRVIVTTPGSPAGGDVTITFQVIDRELEQVHVMVEYSTDGGQTFNPATLVQPSAATNLESGSYPGVTHSIQWDSVSDKVGTSFAQVVCVKITPSDASNPSGAADVSGTFSVDNIAFNEAPVATVLTPAGVSWGNIQITYFLADIESNACSIAVEFSTDSGITWTTAAMGPAGEGMTSLSSSPSGTAHTFLWDSRSDNIAPAGQVDTIKVRITPTDFHQGTAGESNSFSVDNSISNIPPAVAIISGPAEGSTVSTSQVTFTWDGTDTDGTVIGYYYSFDHDPPDNWITGTSVTSGSLSDGVHTFRVAAIDDSFDLSTIVSRSFTVTTFEPLQADFSASTTTGIAPLTVDFTDLSSGSITSYLWDFGDSGTSGEQNPSHTYNSAGTHTVSLTISNAADSDTVTKTDYITVTSAPLTTFYVATTGNDTIGDGTADYPYATIQKGLDSATSGTTVIVFDGIYTGTGNKNLDFNGKDIYLKSSGGAAGCIIDCESSGRGFDFHSGETNDAIVEGFTIQNGDSPTGAGSGIRCYNQTSPTIVECRIVNNNNPGASSLGGGIHCGTDSSPIIRNCMILDNSSGHKGGGITCWTNSSPTISNCLIAGNSAEYGGGIYCQDTSSPTISNCAIYDNTATVAGGGVRCATISSTISVVNCTIANNSGTTEGGGIACNSDSTATVSNTILWGNSAASGNELHVDSGSTITLNHCNYANSPGDVEGSGTVTPNNCITFNPLFVNATAQDYRLLGSSPCIDAGNNSYVTWNEDLDGDLRIRDGDNNGDATVDMGAYEHRTWVDVSPAGTESVDYPSGRYGHAMCFDSQRNVAVLWGGYDGTSYLNDTWEWNGTSWAKKSTAISPTAGANVGMTYDLERGVVVLFNVGNTWEYDGSDWALVDSSGPILGNNTYMAYDPDRQVTVLFGGSALLQETWEWNGTSWTEVVTANNPHGRSGHVMVYDTARKEVVLFGGFYDDGTRHHLNDTWTYDGTDWTEKVVSGPSGRYDPEMVFDNSRGVAVLFGGCGDPWPTHVDDTWEWDGSKWTERFPASKPSPRHMFGMAYDSLRKTVVLFGGIGLFADTWEY